MSSASTVTVDSNVTVNTTWTAAAGTVTVTKSDFTVTESGTLTIASGAVVNLIPGSGDVNIDGVLMIDPGAVIRSYETVQLNVYGTVLCRGTADSMVTFDEHETGRGWDGLYFRNNGVVHQSVFRHTAFNNQDRGTAVTEQHVTFDSCFFIAPHFYDRLFLRTWGGLDRKEGALLEVTGSTFEVASEYDCTGRGCERALIQLDGMDAVICDNMITYRATGAAVTSVCGITGETSNTDPFMAEVCGNAMSMTVVTDYVINAAYGINFSEYTVTGSIADNVITVRTAIDGYGIYGYGGTPVTGNTVSVIKTTAGNGTLYGIYSLSTTDDSSAVIAGNTVALGTAADSVTAYALTGIYMQSGTLRNNVVSIGYGAADGTAKLYGVEKRYYRGRLINNSIGITHLSTADDARGINLGTHPNAADSVPVWNNIISGSGMDGSRGICRSGECASLPVNGYNLVYGFTTAYDGLVAGPGAVADDPQYADSTLKLSIWSPAVDAGDPALDFSYEPEPNGDRINMGAYGNTPSAARSVTDSFYVTVMLRPDFGGAVFGGGAYWYGDTARLAAVPATGFGFTGWSAGTTAVSADTVYAFTVLRSCTLAAGFEPVSGTTVMMPAAVRCPFRIVSGSGSFIWPVPGAAGRIVITDITGRPVVKQNRVRKNGRLNVAGLPAGIYAVRAYVGGTVYEVKFLML